MRHLMVAWLGLALLPSLANAAERYYVMFFGSGNAPRAAHTFAVYFKVTSADEKNGARAEKPKVETFTISWLPATREVRLLNPAEQGRNHGFAETIAWAQRLGTVGDGPFEVQPKIYELALAQRARLESGKVAYKALDRRLRPTEATNCIHAVSDVVPGPMLETGSAVGTEVTPLIRNHYSPHFINGKQTHSWLIEHLETKNGFSVAKQK
jgi:hypothetical protein